MSRCPRIALLTLWPPDARFKVLYKNVGCLPQDRIACCSLQSCRAETTLSFKHMSVDPKQLHWRLRPTALGHVYQHHAQSQQIAERFADWLAPFKPEVLWVLPELGAASVGWHLKQRLGIPLHLTLHDAHETASHIVPRAYYPIYDRCLKRILRDADSIDGISEGMLEYVTPRHTDLSRDEMTVIPPSIQAEYIRECPDETQLDTHSRLRRIGMCGSMRISEAQWSAFLNVLATLPFDFTLLAFVYEDMFFNVPLPANVTLEKMPFAETEQDVVNTFRAAGVHACHLGLWNEPGRELFGQTSLSAKLTTYAATSLPIIVDAPSDSAAWKLIAQYGAGVRLEGRLGVEALQNLFTDAGAWHRAARGTHELAKSEFDLQRNVQRFQKLLCQTAAR